MECTLKCSHAVLEVHRKQAVFNRCRRVVERQQIGIRIGVAFRLLEYTILVQTNDLPKVSSTKKEK